MTRFALGGKWGSPGSPTAVSWPDCEPGMAAQRSTLSNDASAPRPIPLLANPNNWRRVSINSASRFAQDAILSHILLHSGNPGRQSRYLKAELQTSLLGDRLIQIQYRARDNRPCGKLARVEPRIGLGITHSDQLQCCLAVAAVAVLLSRKHLTQHTDLSRRRQTGCRQSEGIPQAGPGVFAALNDRPGSQRPGRFDIGWIIHQDQRLQRCVRERPARRALFSIGSVERPKR